MCCKLRPSNRQYSLFKKVLEFVLTCSGRLFKLTMRVLGPIMFGGANVLAGIVILIHIFVLMPPLISQNILLYTVNLIFIIWGAINIYFNYWACMLTPPGSPDFCSDPGGIFGTVAIVKDGVKNYKALTSKEVALNVDYRYCQQCPCIKPPRAHHCSVSGRCILNMDHYCPWMCNCVGYGNYRYFVLFLLYMSLGSFYVVCFTLSDMVQMTPEERSYVSITAMVESNLLQNARAATLSYTTLAFTLALSACVSTTSLLIWHLYLAFTNQTTIEFYINMARKYDPNRKGEYRNPFDEGWRKNLRRVLGDAPWYAHLLPNTSPPAPPRYSFTLEDRSNTGDGLPATGGSRGLRSHSGDSFDSDGSDGSDESNGAVGRAEGHGWQVV